MAMVWADVYDITAYTFACDLNAAGLLRAEPRVFRKGDAKPDDTVRALLDSGGGVWTRWADVEDNWDGASEYEPRKWEEFSYHFPLVEIFLPKVVIE